MNQRRTSPLTLLASLMALSASLLVASPALAFNNAICEPDSNTFCLGVISQGGSQALLKCLRENESKLSAACKAAIAKDKPDSKANLGR